MQILAGILPVAILLVASAPGQVLMSGPQEREVRVLVVPPNPSNRPLPQIHPEDVHADLAGKSVSVLAVDGKEVASQTPVVIVLDFANTSLANWPCLAAEVEPFVNRVDQSKLQVFVTDPRYNVFYTTDFGNPILPVTLFSAPTSGSWSGQCAGKKKGDFPSTSVQFVWRDASALLHELGRKLPAHDGPYRVIWISEDFGWWNTRLRLFKPEDFSYDFNTPEMFRPTDESLESAGIISSAGISIFPIVLAAAPRHAGTLGTVSAFNRRAANMVAHFTGGFTTVAGRKPGRTLKRVLAATANGYVFRLHAPFTGPKWFNGLPHVLNLKESGGEALLRRPFVVIPELPLVPDKDSLLHSFYRLMIPSNNLQVTEGCAAQSSGDWISLSLPPSVTSAPGGKLAVQVESIGGMKQRLTLDRGRSTSPPCVELPSARDGKEFRVIAFDEETGWVGAINCRIASSTRRR